MTWRKHVESAEAYSVLAFMHSGADVDSEHGQRLLSHAGEVYVRAFQRAELLTPDGQFDRRHRRLETQAPEDSDVLKLRPEVWRSRGTG